MSVDKMNAFVESLETFSRDLYQQLIGLHPKQDLICSPLSIQVCAAMLRMGAEDESVTAKQLDEGMKFSSSNANHLADSFLIALQAYQEYSVLNMANRVYIMNNYHLQQEFSDALTQKFLSQPELIDFSKGQMAANTINAWVESQTKQLITNFVRPEVLDAETRIILVNAIHFKGEWRLKFDESATKDEDFFINSETKINVKMMNSMNDYLYENFPNLNAKGLSMAYKDSKLFMLILLPDGVNDLNILEEKLKTITLRSIISQLKQSQVCVKLPKFKAEFEAELTPVFKGLGIEKIFSQPEFSKMLEENEALQVSKILHKAYIEVNEEGTEAAASTAAVVQLRSMPAPQKQPEVFHVQQPFVYIIYDEDHGCLFMGNIKTFNAFELDPDGRGACTGCETDCPKTADPMEEKKTQKKD